MTNFLSAPFGIDLLGSVLDNVDTIQMVGSGIISGVTDFTANTLTATISAVLKSVVFSSDARCSSAGAYRMGWGTYPFLAFGLGSTTALPAAGVLYRGEIRTVRGGGGVADITYQCLKSAAGAYSWVQIATG